MATVQGGQFRGPTQAELKQAQLDRFGQSMRDVQAAIQNFMQLKEQKRQFDVASRFQAVNMAASAYGGDHSIAAKFNPEIYRDLIYAVYGKEGKGILEGFQKGIYSPESWNRFMETTYNMGLYTMESVGAQPPSRQEPSYREERREEGPATWQPIPDIEGPSQARRTLLEQRGIQTEMRTVPGGAIQLPPEEQTRQIGRGLVKPTTPSGFAARGEVTPGATAQVPYGEKLVGVPSGQYAAEATMPVARIETLPDGRMAYIRMEEQGVEEKIVADYMIQHLGVNPYENPQEGKLVARWMAEHNPEMEIPGDLDEKGLAALRNTPASRYRYEVPKNMEQARRWERAKKATTPTPAKDLEKVDLGGTTKTQISGEANVTGKQVEAFVTSPSSKTPNGLAVAKRLRVVVNRELARGMFPQNADAVMKDLERGAAWIEEQARAQNWKTPEDVVNTLFLPQRIVEGKQARAELLKAEAALLLAETEAEYFPQVLAAEREEIKARRVEAEARQVVAGINMDIAQLEYKMRLLMQKAAESGAISPELLMDLYKADLTAYTNRVLSIYKEYPRKPDKVKEKIKELLKDETSDLSIIRNMLWDTRAMIYGAYKGSAGAGVPEIGMGTEPSGLIDPNDPLYEQKMEILNETLEGVDRIIGRQ